MHIVEPAATIYTFRDTYNLNEMVNIVEKILERVHHTSLTLHAPDYSEHKQRPLQFVFVLTSRRYLVSR